MTDTATIETDVEGPDEDVLSVTVGASGYYGAEISPEFAPLAAHALSNLLRDVAGLDGLSDGLRADLLRAYDLIIPPRSPGATDART